MKLSKLALLVLSSSLIFGCDLDNTEETTTSSDTVSSVSTSGNSVLLDDDSASTYDTDGTTVLVSGDTPELRLNLGDAYATGTVSVDVMYASDEDQTAYLTLYGSSASSSYLIADVKMDESYKNTDGYVGIQLRNDATYGAATLAEFAAATWTNVQVAWDNSVSVDNDFDDTYGGEYYVTVGSTQYGPFDMNVSDDVEYIVLKIGSNDGETTSATPLYIDNLTITSGSTTVHSDDFDDYTVGTDLTGTDSYNSSGYNAIVSDAQDATTTD
jgi:hypothetical protein